MASYTRDRVAITTQRLGLHLRLLERPSADLCVSQLTQPAAYANICFRSDPGSLNLASAESARVMFTPLQRHGPHRSISAWLAWIGASCSQLGATSGAHLTTEAVVGPTASCSLPWSTAVTTASGQINPRCIRPDHAPNPTHVLKCCSSALAGTGRRKPPAWRRTAAPERRPRIDAFAGSRQPHSAQPPCAAASRPWRSCSLLRCCGTAQPRAASAAQWRSQATRILSGGCRKRRRLACCLVLKARSMTLQQTKRAVLTQIRREKRQTIQSRTQLSQLRAPPGRLPLLPTALQSLAGQ